MLGWKPVQAQPQAQTQAQAAASSPTAASAAGSHDFDFLIGDWKIANRKRLAVLRDDDRWERFEAVSHARPLPGGVGNFDDFISDGWRPGRIGVTLRVFNARTGLWSLYWMTNQGGGIDPLTNHLEPPVVGRWQGDQGVFEGDDTYEGRPIRVRYTWRRLDADHAHWEQAFSADQGRRWETNWTMELTRRPAAAA